jgi:hypothetical protein
MERRSNRESQTWEIKYKNEIPPEPKKGELNKDFGLLVQTDFHIVSGLGKKRYLDVVSGWGVIKTDNARRT